MKKILCLILSAIMMFSCFAMNSQAAEYYERPDAVAKVIDPIISAANSAFANSINVQRYDSVAIARNIPVGTYESFINNNGSDEMLGISLDFLYSKNTGTFLWSLCNFDLVVDESAHEKEVQKAVNNKQRSSCEAKGLYDACAEVLYGYEYEYQTKAFDTELFEKIVEVTTTVYNSYTKKHEIHYDYHFSMSKGEFSLMRANFNRQIINTVSEIYGTGMLYSTPEKASENAIKIANFIGNLLYPNFVEIAEGTNVFTDNVSIRDEVFFGKVTELSGLDVILQNNWCNAKDFDVKKIMSALGVIVKDDVILNIELEKGVNMGARILTDMFGGFLENPIGYVTNLIQLFSRNYSSLYSKAIEALFALKYPSVSNLTKSDSDASNDYDGSELSTPLGLFNFISDCIYWNKVSDKAVDSNNNSSFEAAELDAAKQGIKKFVFAPTPSKRFAIATDSDEFFLYLLCYFNINYAYGDNSGIIDKFISGVDKELNEKYTEKDKSKTIPLTKEVLNTMFKADLTFSDMYVTFIGALTENNIAAFPDNFMSSIKNALAGLIQRFVQAMDNFMNVLFGWTDGIFGENGFLGNRQNA